jgi:hypothetical protein
MHLTQDMDQWRVLVKTGINLQVPLKACFFGGGAAGQILFPQKGLYSLLLVCQRFKQLE